MRHSFWLAAFACVAAPAAAQQRTAGPPQEASTDSLRLTRREAIARALLANPQLDVAREQTEQVRAQRVEGISLPDPALTASWDSLPGPFRFGRANSKLASLAFAVPFPDKLRLRNTIGVSNLRVSEAQFRLTQQAIASRAGIAYDSVLVTRLHHRDLIEARRLAAEFLKRAEARFNAGSVARLDVIKAQVDLAQADNDLIASTRDVANAEAALNRVIGRPLSAPIAPTDSLAAPPPLPALEDLEAAAQRSRPEITAIEAQQRAAKATSALARENAILPDFALSANRDRMLPEQGTWYQAGFSLSLPIFFWQHTRGDFAETRHRELELAAALRDQRAAVGQDVRTAFANADAAQRQVAFLRDQLLPSAREAYRVATVSYGLGGLSALDVFDARRTLLDAERQYADALAAANSARSDLERAAGVPLSTFASGASRE